MSAVATQHAQKSRTRHSAQRRRGAEVARRESGSRVDDGQTPSTLEDALSRAWEDLSSRGRAECLVCGDALEAAPEMGAPPALGECRRCGASLA